MLDNAMPSNFVSEVLLEIERVAAEAAERHFRRVWQNTFGEPALIPNGKRADGSIRYVPSASAMYVIASRRLADKMPLSKAHVAAILDCSEKHVDRLRALGHLHAGKDGSRVIFEAGSVAAYVRSIYAGEARRG